MIDAGSIDALAAARRDAHLARPLYEGYGFAQIPSLVRSLLCGAETGMAPSVVDRSRPPKAVVTLLLDGFGWRFFERFESELPFLRRLVRDGVVSKLSAQFPSTTAAHVTTLHTGLPVGESGLFEWQYLEPTLGAVFMPLPGLTVTATGASAVRRPPPGTYPDTTLYAELRQLGLPTFCYQSARYADSAYSRAVTAGAEMIPFRTLPEATVELVQRIETLNRPSYHCVYFDVIDTIAHAHGPSSRHLEAEVRAVFHLLEDQLPSALAGTDTLMLITADHGHIAVDPARTVELDVAFPALPGWLETGRDGRPLAPAGSARDQFLYVRPEYLDEAEATLRSGLDGVATVHRVDALVEDGWFGPVGPRLRARLSPLVVLPLPNEQVWWSGDGRFAQAMRGHHGGLSPDELEIPLLAWWP